MRRAVEGWWQLEDSTQWLMLVTTVGREMQIRNHGGVVVASFSIMGMEKFRRIFVGYKKLDFNVEFTMEDAP